MIHVRLIIICALLSLCLGRGINMMYYTHDLIPENLKERLIEKNEQFLPLEPVQAHKTILNKQTKVVENATFEVSFGFIGNFTNIHSISNGLALPSGNWDYINVTWLMMFPTLVIHYDFFLFIYNKGQYIIASETGELDIRCPLTIDNSVLLYREKSIEYCYYPKFLSAEVVNPVRDECRAPYKTWVKKFGLADELLTPIYDEVLVPAIRKTVTSVVLNRLVPRVNLTVAGFTLCDRTSKFNSKPIRVKT